MSELPLSALLSHSIVDLRSAFVTEGAGANDVPSPPMWFGFLRVIDNEEESIKALPAKARLSRRQIRGLCGAAKNGGWVTVDGDTVTRTDAGGAVAAKWAGIAKRADATWSARVGKAAAKELHAALADVVGRFELELPHYPISYGTADPSITGGQPHGQDWRPVIRTGTATTKGLSMMPLLSQALVQFSIDCARKGTASLLMSEGISRGFGHDDEAPLATLPPVLGIDGSGRTLLERHGVVKVNAKKIVHLTPIGRFLRDAYPRAVKAVEEDWGAAYSSDSVERLRRALETVDAQLPGDLPHYEIATHIRR